MTRADWNNLIMTVIGVFGLAALSRRAKAGIKVPSVPPWIPFVLYNLLWAAVLVVTSRSALVLPGFAAPVGLVGGNAALVNLFGFPWARKVDKAGAGVRGDPALDRERLEPKRRKKKRQKSRR